MARVHLFELEDQPWFPAVIRDAGTAYLQFMAALGGQAKEFAPTVGEALERSGTDTIVDLCSGGAGPVPTLVEALAEDGRKVTATLTDFYPNTEALQHAARNSGGAVEFVPESVDATAVPPALRGLRTLFNALHHFRPEQARSILQNAVDAGQPICAIELVSRHPLFIVSMLFASIPVMLAVPFLRPFRWAWLPLTYLVPVIPLFVSWDGFVSCLRVYSPDELRELIASLDGGDRFYWEIGTIPMPPSPVGATYVYGVPRADVR